MTEVLLYIGCKMLGAGGWLSRRGEVPPDFEFQY